MNAHICFQRSVIISFAGFNRVADVYRFARLSEESVAADSLVSFLSSISFSMSSRDT